MLNISDARNNKELFTSLFNRYAVYAPYTLSLNEHLFDKYLASYKSDAENIIWIGEKGPEHGIIHIGKYDKNGIVYMLFADSNQLAAELLCAAEKWCADNKIVKLLAYLGYPSPYQYILHGSEAYLWAGNYHANNAFNKAGYDLDLDVLVMSMKLSAEKHGFDPEVAVSDIDISKEVTRDDELALAGRFVAKSGGKWVGHCGFHYLKAISAQIKRKTGQIDIWLNNEYHGAGLAKALAALTHHELYNLGVERVMLATNQALFRAVQFYEKTGYTTEPIRAYSYSKML